VNKVGKQIIAAFRNNAIVPFIVGGAIIVAIPTFIFVLTRLVYLRAIKETLTPAAVKKLDAWRKGQVELASRPDALSSLAASIKNGWLPVSIKQVTAVLDRFNRRKNF
jgi:hypothetical protein